MIVSTSSNVVDNRGEDLRFPISSSSGFSSPMRASRKGRPFYFVCASGSPPLTAFSPLPNYRYVASLTIWNYVEPTHKVAPRRQHELIVPASYDPSAT